MEEDIDEDEKYSDDYSNVDSADKTPTKSVTPPLKNIEDT
jgi:hypothetical protein